MITLGFNNKRSTYARAAMALAIGAVFIVFAVFFGANAWSMVVQVASMGVVAVGIFLCFSALLQKSRSQDKTWSPALSWMLSSAVLTVLVGVAIFFFAKPLSRIFALLIGILSLVVGLYQVIVLASTSKMIKLSPLLFVLPSVLAACGAVVLIYWKKVDVIVGCMTGAVLILYGLSELVAQWRIQQILKKGETVEVEEVFTSQTADKVDEQ